MESREKRGWAHKLRWVHAKDGRQNLLIFPETHHVKISRLKVNECFFIRRKPDEKWRKCTIQNYATDTNERLLQYETVLNLLSRSSLCAIVTDLGGNADEAQMQSDNYRANIRKRARELIQWILVSGDSSSLGVTKDNIINTWARRYRQQRFQAWASPLGKAYDPVGKTEMHTPKLIRRSLALELEEEENATEADYEPSIELPASAKSRKRREKTSSLIQSEIRSGKNEQNLLRKVSNVRKYLLSRPFETE
ncbi:Oidioi.mRNA.OKI2018_I69.XSR.g15894.t1.cds [Oikopleura dioica]|uniref:Oidioi.mRNA.OKI2018_I69.XSR.g15894.t1.cds n=1 Tax=Oikopleura dioica TaxID=34765 RepID=A0ABN7SEB4_OIKDI|nr:Oidioi.mRNA.OKI2018_I69.XSR.g15894.t1.cds [Oikopleura dioica]